MSRVEELKQNIISQIEKITGATQICLSMQNATPTDMMTGSKDLSKSLMQIDDGLTAMITPYMELYAICYHTEQLIRELDSITDDNNFHERAKLEENIKGNKEGCITHFHNQHLNHWLGVKPNE